MVKITKGHKITSKNQITLPAHVMNELNLKIGDSVYFAKEYGEIVLKKDKEFSGLPIRYLKKILTEKWSYRTVLCVSGEIKPHDLKEVLPISKDLSQTVLINDNTLKNGSEGVVEDILSDESSNNPKLTLILDNVISSFDKQLNGKLNNQDVWRLLDRFMGRIVIFSSSKQEHKFSLEGASISSIELILKDNFNPNNYSSEDFKLIDAIRYDGFFIENEILFSNK